MASISTMRDYYSILNNIYDGNVETKLLSLGSNGNGIEVVGDNAFISGNTATLNGGYGILVYGDNSYVANNQVTGNAGGISVIGDHAKIKTNTANENDWVGIYVRTTDRRPDVYNSVIKDCTAEHNGIGIVVSGVVFVTQCHANYNKLDGMLAIGDYSAMDINPLNLFNGLLSNEVKENGANGIYSYGNNAMALNYGEGNSLVGIMEYGNPLLLAPPNSADGVIGSQMPPSVQILQLADCLSVYGIVDFVIGRVTEWLSSLQSNFND